jgi:hypothetical protein
LKTANLLMDTQNVRVFILIDWSDICICWPHKLDKLFKNIPHFLMLPFCLAAWLMSWLFYHHLCLLSMISSF